MRRTIVFPIFFLLVLLFSCGKEDETPLPEAPEGTEWKSSVVNSDEIGGQDLKVFSAFQKSSPVEKNSFQTIVSQKGIQVIFLLDNNNNIRGLTSTKKQGESLEIVPFDAKSTVDALFLLTPGLSSSNKDETEELFSRLSTIASYSKCVSTMRSLLSSKTLSDARKNTQFDSLFSQSIKEYYDLYIDNSSQKKSIESGSGISITKTSDNKVRIENDGMRFVDVWRVYIYDDGDIGYSKIFNGMKGKTSTSWGALSKAIGPPTIEIDNMYSPRSQTTQTTYWVLGVGIAPYSERPPYYIDVTNYMTDIKSVVFYFGFNLLDVLVGGTLEFIGDPNVLAPLWSAYKGLKEVEDFQSAESLGEKAAAYIKLIKVTFNTILSNEQLCNLLKISSQTARDLITVLQLGDIVLGIVDAGFYLYEMTNYPQYAKFEIGTNPDPPILTSPSDGSQNQSTTVTLSWERNLQQTPTSYMVEVAANSSFSNPIFQANVGLNINQEISGLANSQDCFWRVHCVNNNGWSDWSEVWSFTTGSGISPPTITTNEITEFTQTSAIVGGSISSSGGSTIIDKGVFWGTSPNPETTGLKRSMGDGEASFSGSLTGLTPNTRYYVNAYATNSEGTSLGGQVSFTTVVAGNPPEALFVANPTMIEVGGGSVNFYDQSTNNPTSWSWDFGDGGTSTSQNPSYQYNVTGTFTVSLTVSNIHGQDTYTRSDYITAGEAPEVEFTSSETTVNLGESIQFTDESTNNPTSWRWDFGDGEFSTQQNPTYTYSNPGTYTVILIAMNDFGSNHETKTDYITVEPVGIAPVAEFSGSPRTISEREGVVFYDQSTNNPTYWLWDFGDGSTVEAINVTHVYQNPGVYTVTLTVSNDYGTDSETKVDYITVEPEGYPPEADFTVSDQTITEGQTVQFTDQSTNNPASWSWNFGDGGTSTESDPSHQYNTPGTYTVTLTATNAHGSDSETKVDYITVDPEGYPPVAEFTASETTITEGETVVFTDQSTNSPTSWSWDFGDGGTSTQQNPSHPYDTPGTYTVTLTATNAHGSDSEIKSGYITVDEDSGGETGTVTDIDGNVYTTVRIGDQWWMAENLIVTRYSDGTPLVDGTGVGDIRYDYTTRYYFSYNDNESYVPIYGRLYTWAATMNGAASSDENPSGVQGVCPSGWHVPSRAEWNELLDYLGGTDIAGGKLKEEGTSHWEAPNEGATNESGFTGLPGSYRAYTGYFPAIGRSGVIWTSWESSSDRAQNFGLNYDFIGVIGGYGMKEMGISVRCVQD